MNDAQDLVRSMSADEVSALGPLPDPDTVSPTTDRDDRAPASTAEVHSPGVLPAAHYAAADDDPFPPPRSLTEEG
jgi:hypothetical protein